MNELISIIIPIYNVEKYLSECLESVIAQTYDNLEILLIDDGSTDNSGKICDKYAQKDSRIKVKHKENGGVSSARNLGLNIAQGEYIAFIDSDDFVDKTYIEKMYKNAKELNSDLIFCKYAGYADGAFTYNKENVPKQLNVDTNNEVFMSFVYRFFDFNNYLLCSCWRILYKKRSIEDIYFHLGIKISEDLLFLIKALLKVRRITSIDDCLYFYRQRETSAVHGYKKGFLQGQLNLYHEFKQIFKGIHDKNTQKILQIHDAFLCYRVFANEIKFKVIDRKKNIEQARKSELYKHFKLKNGLRIYGLKRKIKFLIVWLLVKTRLV